MGSDGKKKDKKGGGGVYNPNFQYENYQKEKKDNTYSLQYLFIWFMLSIWAFILTMKLEPGPQKVQNIFLAILCPPIYIIAHYLGFNNNNK